MDKLITKIGTCGDLIARFKAECTSQQVYIADIPMGSNNAHCYKIRIPFKQEGMSQWEMASITRNENGIEISIIGDWEFQELAETFQECLNIRKTT